jgi:hypothetical protein
MITINVVKTVVKYGVISRDPILGVWRNHVTPPGANQVWKSPLRPKESGYVFA